MDNPEDWLALALFVSVLLLGIGSWILHRKMRTRASLALVSSIAMILAWLFVVSSGFDYFVMGMPAIQQDKSLLNIAFITNNFVIPSLLLLFSSASFFAVAKSLRPAV